MGKSAPFFMLLQSLIFIVFNSPTGKLQKRRSIKADALTLPAESTLAEELETVDLTALRNKAKGGVKLLPVHSRNNYIK
jgi:hypothetical protein